MAPDLSGRRAGSGWAALIRKPRDFWSGAIFLVVGVFAIVVAQDYALGSARRMGPAYFPILLGGLLALIGAALIVKSLLGDREAPLPALEWRPLAIVLGAVAVFGLIVRGSGLLPAVVVLAVASACASRRFRLGPALLVGLGSAVFSWAMFVFALGLPLSAFGPWLGF